MEVKLGFHYPLDYDVDIYFFAPPTLGVSQHNAKSEFLDCLRSYVRLETSMGLGQSADHVTPERVSVQVQRLADALEAHCASGQILTTIKQTAVAYEAYLKSRKKAHRRAQKRASTEQLVQELALTEKLVNQVRQHFKQDLNEHVQISLNYLNEYLSYLMMDYLASFNDEVRQIKDSTERERLQLRLAALAKSEFEYRRRMGLVVSSDASADAKAEYLYKVGLLKKYFQRPLFIQVRTSPVAKKVFQPVAALAAALAAAWAGLFQQAQNANSVFSRLGLTPISILLLGVFAYVIKDRLKETVRHFLAGKVEKVLPDIERTLVYKNEDGFSNELGRIRETIRKISHHELPTHVSELRYSRGYLGLEAELGEDVIHYNKKILLKSLKRIPDSQWGLREILRISLRSYLRNLDDPFKEVSFVDDTGRVNRSEAHRIYMAHLALELSYSFNGARQRELKLAQLTLDKSGLVKVAVNPWDESPVFDQSLSSVDQVSELI